MTFGKITLEQFKLSGKELLQSLPNLNLNQIENGRKCLNIMYLGLNKKDFEMANKAGFYNYFQNKINQKISILLFNKNQS